MDLDEDSAKSAKSEVPVIIKTEDDDAPVILTSEDNDPPAAPDDAPTILKSEDDDAPAAPDDDAPTILKFEDGDAPAALPAPAVLPASATPPASTAPITSAALPTPLAPAALPTPLAPATLPTPAVLPVPAAPPAPAARPTSAALPAPPDDSVPNAMLYTAKPEFSTVDRPSKVYAYVKVTPCDDGRALQQCKFCGYKKVTRELQPTPMAKHIILCDKAPPSAKLDVAKMSRSREVRAAAHAVGLLSDDDAQNVPLAPAHAVINNTASNSTSVVRTIHSYINVTPVANGKIEQQCIFCDYKKETTQFNATVMSTHIIKCPNAPLSAKRSVALTSRSKEVSAVAEARGLYAPGTGSRKRPVGSLDTKTLPDVHTYIKVVPKQNGKSEQQCIFCDYKRDVKRLHVVAAAKHLMLCANAPTHLKHAFVQHYGPNETTTTAEASGPDKLDSLHLPAMKRQKLKSASPQTTKSSILDQVTEEPADSIFLSIMRFIAGCGLTMAIVESPFFTSMMKTFNKDFVDKNVIKAADFTQVWLPKLFKSVEDDISFLWKDEGNAKRTIGIDKFINRRGHIIILFSEALLDKISFKNIVAQDEARATNDTTSDLILHHLELSAASKSVDEVYSAVTFSDFEENANTIAQIQKKYPKLFTNGCRMKWADFIYKDILSIVEVQAVLNNVADIYDFISSNSRVKNAFRRLARQHGGTVVQAPIREDMFPLVQNLESLLGFNNKNIDALRNLVSEEQWEKETTMNLKRADIVKFCDTTKDANFFEKSKALLKLFYLLKVFKLLFERTDVRASWIHGAYQAFQTDINAWCNNKSTCDYFEQTTLKKIKDVVDERWYHDGSNRQNMFYSKEILMASCLDPSTLPNVETLPSNWHQECEVILSRFFRDQELAVARQELMRVVLRQGYWGDYVNKCQKTLHASLDGVNADVPRIERIARLQLLDAHERPHLMWDAVFKNQFPNIQIVASRLLVMSTQAGHVERACGQAELLHSIDHRRLTFESVQRLLYCHVNLRLLVKEKGRDVMSSFLEQALLSQIPNAETSDGEDGDERADVKVAAVAAGSDNENLEIINNLLVPGYYPLASLAARDDNGNSDINGDD